ncbi:MAG: DMT family transporter [Bacteroidales bacterium]|nr:DMT family transporter [Bacteroidales bacterium]
MGYIGEIISLGVAFLWTVTALVSDLAVKQLGVFVSNVWRMLAAMILSGVLMWIFCGDFWPVYANSEAWIWLLISGVVGYFFGDWCLFNSYIWIGPRYGQLFMTLAPLSSAIAAYFTLSEPLSWKSILAMIVTLIGISISILGKGEDKKIKLQLPLKGILFGIGAGVGQGIGIVLSKIGMNYYTEGVPSDVLPDIQNYLAFSSNQIRCIAGFICFTIWLLLRGEFPKLKESYKNHKGMLMVGLAVIFGPFLGVGFSLMAVNYVEAGIASTLMALTPVIIILPSRLIYKEKITFKTISGAIVAVLGASLFFLLK